MEILKFKTNINSDSDLQKITSLLNNEKNIHLWNMDTENAEHILNKHVPK